MNSKFSCIDKYVISQEEHTDEPERGKHVHIYLEFTKKVNILSSSALYLKEGDKKIHGEYLAVKRKNDVISYVKKDGNFNYPDQLLQDFNPLRINDINALKNLKPEHKAIILDDLNWKKVDREVKIELLEKARDSNIKIIYQVVDLPADLIKVVIYNNPQNLKDYWDVDPAVNRRIFHVHLDKPLYNQNADVIINYFNK